MSPDLTAIRKALDAFDNADWDEVHLVTDEFELHLESHDAAARNEIAPIATAHRPPSASGPDEVPESAVRAGPEAGAGTAERPTADTADPGPTAHSGIPVTAPSLGIFWAAPSPGSPPFVTVGKSVTADTTLCIIEVMKLMNNVKAPITGRITAILVENGSTVEAGDKIMLIDPDDANEATT